MVAPMAGILRHGREARTEKTVEKDYMIYRRKVQFGHDCFGDADAGSTGGFKCKTVWQKKRNDGMSGTGTPCNFQTIMLYSKYKIESVRGGTYAQN